MAAPTLTLNGSAKPWMVLLGLGTSQVVCGVPVSWFSHTTGLAQAAWAGVAGEITSTAPASVTAKGAARRGRSRLRARSGTRLSLWARFPRRYLLMIFSYDGFQGVRHTPARAVGLAIKVGPSTTATPYQGGR